MAKRRVYWDACVFIGLLNSEPGKVDETLKVWREAERGETEIWTSAFSMVEVYKAKCEGKQQPLDPAKEQQINDLFAQPFVEVVIVDLRSRSRHGACSAPITPNAKADGSGCTSRARQTGTWMSCTRGTEATCST
ncbi:MAG: hypothetical protein IPJ78_18880 [Gemmatimonadetes bacterium]|nr:hypothetical protein [Gemmatimonadota bacterium]